MAEKSKPNPLNRREFLTGTGALLLTPSALAERIAGSGTETRSRPGEASSQLVPQKRPAWWRENGLVMAGVDWESLLFRLRRSSDLDYDEKIAIWRSEHGEEIARRVKDLGFNFVMIPLYKGGGLQVERPSMEDAKRFTKICHGIGLRVGCYTFSGTVFYEPMLAENPGARDWFTMDHSGSYVTYGPMYFRRFVNRDHPGFRALAREIVRFAVVEAQMDLIHFDNYDVGPSYEPYSVQRFREYLENKYLPEQRRQRFGFAQMSCILPPPAAPHADQYNGDPLYRDFIDFRCEVMADTYRELAEYARSLNPEILVDLNAGGYYGRLISSLGIGTVDHTRTIQWGSAFWDEGYQSRLQGGSLISRFRSQMLGRHFENMVFHYTPDRVAIAESMANNLQCLGCAAQVKGDKVIPTLAEHNGTTELDPAVLASIRFFRREQEYFRDAEPVADIGVLNTYANTAYGPDIARDRWAAFTQALYQSKIPFGLVPAASPGNLGRYRALVLADLALISEPLLDNVRDYTQKGGGLVLTGQATLFDEQGHRRKHSRVADFFTEPLGGKTLRAKIGRGRAIYVPQITIPEKFRVGMLPENRAELLEAVRWAAGEPLTVEVEAPETVTMSLYSQPTGRHILHLVNYDVEHPVNDIEITLRLPPSSGARSVRMLSPDAEGAETLAAEQHEQAVRFTVRRLEVYRMLAIS